MKRWTFDYPAARVFSVECEERGYPNRDERGEIQFDNTHFDSEGEAFGMLLREAKAAVSMGERDFTEATARLEKVTRDLAEAAAVFARVMRESEKRAEVSHG